MLTIWSPEPIVTVLDNARVFQLTGSRHVSAASQQRLSDGEFKPSLFLMEVDRSSAKLHRERARQDVRQQSKIKLCADDRFVYMSTDDDEPSTTTKAQRSRRNDEMNRI